MPPPGTCMTHSNSWRKKQKVSIPNIFPPSIFHIMLLGSAFLVHLCCQRHNSQQEKTSLGCTATENYERLEIFYLEDGL